jgi:hypothetical protein
MGTTGSSSTGLHPNTALPRSFPPECSPFSPFSPLSTLTRANRPRNDIVTPSALPYAKATASFTMLTMTPDTFLLRWRPCGLNTAILSFAAGVGVQVDASEPAFIRQQPQPPLDIRPTCPLDLDGFRVRLPTYER